MPTTNTVLSSSDPFASHPTELLQHALAPQSQEHSRDWDLAPPNDGITTIDFSLDSRIIPNRSATPRYHLQVSSLQSPEDSGEPVLAEDSRKQKRAQENEGQVQGGTCYIVVSPPSKKELGSRLESGSEFFRQQAGSPVTASAGKVIGTRAASFQSPPTTTGLYHLPRSTKSMPGGNRLYRRSPSLPSQDSFGGPISQDPAELYLASAKQFNAPLSDLGDTPTQIIHSPTGSGLMLPDANEHNDLFQSSMSRNEAQRAATSNCHANVLVAATPSNSGESSGMSQYKNNDFSFRKHAPEFGQGSRFEFNGSSSFDKMLDRDLGDALDPSLELTEPLEIQQTQVEPRVDPLASPPNNKQRSPPFEWTVPTPSGAVASSNPRSLLRMVHPENEYRIAKMRNLAGAVEPPSCVTMSAETLPSRVEETQLCHIDGSTSSNSRTSARSAPRQARLVGSHQVMHQLHKVDEDEPEDTLDIVPDSEPLRAGPSSRTPTHRRALRTSPTKPFRPYSPMSELGSGDVAPDSLETEGSEVDVPLATEVVSRNKEKPVPLTGNVTVQGRRARTTSALPEKDPLALKIQHYKPSSFSVKGRKPSKTDVTEVPTSLPEQDLHGQPPSSGQPPATSTDPPPSRKRRAPQYSEPSRARHASRTSLPAPKPVAGRKRSHTTETENSEDSPHLTEDEGVTRSKVLKEESESESDIHDIDPPPPPPPKPDTSRKKRRTEDANPTRGMSKASTSTRSKWSETPVVATRSVKRLRSGLSSTHGLAAEAVTQVFALWRQDGHYYSGIVHSRGLKNKYLIKFDDGTEDEVDLKNLRRRELVSGDRVISISDNLKCVVGDASHADPHGDFVLEMDDGEVVSSHRAEFRDIRIANRTIQSQWSQRTLDPADIIPVIRPKLPVDPTPSKQSVVSTTSGKPHREFLKTGFVVTINPKNDEPIQTKDEAMRAIKRHGGLVIEDWSCVFVMEGKHSQSSKRWVATPQDFRWKSGVKLDRVFLLSDEAHQKPKFLLALALGIPCISFEWLTKEGDFSSDWQQFLLPAGYSDKLGARVSQLVDLDWGNCTEHLTDIMTSRVPFKLFSEKTVLCVGADLIPLPTNRTRKNVTDEASRYVPWIILCMGAAKVEAISDTKQVPPSHLQAFDYIIVKERAVLGSLKLGNAQVGGINWVKDCLVSSRLSRPELD